MPTPEELQEKLWAGLRSEMTVMLGREGGNAPARPMTAMIDGDEDRGPLWFFTATDNNLYRQIQQVELAGDEPRAMAHFVAKGHDVWATVHGSLTTTRDRAIIDRLWNRFVAACYEGKDDPKIALIRLDPEDAEIWIDASSLVAGIKMLMGFDPKKDYEGKVAELRL